MARMSYYGGGYPDSSYSYSRGAAGSSYGGGGGAGSTAYCHGQSGYRARDGSEDLYSKKRKVQNTICVNFIRGHCAKGSRCPKPHIDYVESMEERKILSKQKFCHDFQNHGICNRSKDCRFLHVTRREERDFLKTGTIPQSVFTRTHEWATESTMFDNFGSGGGASIGRKHPHPNSGGRSGGGFSGWHCGRGRSGARGRGTGRGGSGGPGHSSSQFGGESVGAAAISQSSHCYVFSQITSLVASTSRKNFKTNQAEIKKLIELYGPDADRHLFRRLVSSVDFTTDGRNLGKDGQQLQLLIQEANALITKPNFVSILCYAFEKQENVRPSQQLFSQLIKVLKLTKVQEVVFALGLKNSSDSDLQNYASQHLKNALPELVHSYSDFSSGLEGGLAEAAIEVLHLLLSHLLKSPQNEVGVNKEAIETFVQTMRQDFPRERVPKVLATLLYREQQDIIEDRLVPVSAALPSSMLELNGGGLPGLPFSRPLATTSLSPKTSSYPAKQAQQQPPMQQGFPMNFGGMGFGGGGQAKHPHQAAAAAGLQLQQQQLGQAAKPMGDPIILGPEQTFSKDVDDKANAYFQAIYNRGMNVDRLLELLKQFKDSLNKKERDLFVCMVRNMFEEYKFFPQFPEKELQITGQLFGGIIEYGLVTYMSLSLALRYVLDSLKKVPGTKMSLFGIAALDKFKTRLHEFPHYCASIATIPHFQSFPNYLKQIILNVEHYKAYQQALQDGLHLTLRYLKFLFFGPPRSGKTSTRRRLLREIINLYQLSEPSISTGLAETSNVIIKKFTNEPAAVTSSQWWSVKRVNKDNKQADVHSEGDLYCLAQLFYQLICNCTTSVTSNQPAVVHPRGDSSEATTSTPSSSEMISSMDTQDNTQLKPVANVLPDLEETEIKNAFEKLTTILQSNSPEELKQFLEDLTLINMTDVGGQPAFLDMLPALTTGPALYLLFFRLDQELKTYYDVRYLPADCRDEITLESSYCIEEVLFRSLASIACFSCHSVSVSPMPQESSPASSAQAPESAASTSMSRASSNTSKQLSSSSAKSASKPPASSSTSKRLSSSSAKSASKPRACSSTSKRLSSSSAESASKPRASSSTSQWLSSSSAESASKPRASSNTSKRLSLSSAESASKPQASSRASKWLSSSSAESASKPLASSSTPKLLLSSSAESASKPQASSRALLFGTYKDKVNGDQISQIESTLQERFMRTKLYGEGLLMKSSKGKMTFMVDNMFGTDESELSDIREDLERIIKANFPPVPIPASWLMFEIVLQLLNKPVVSLAQCEEIAKQLSMPTPVREAIWFFHHNIGSLMHYPDIPSIKDMVICNPQVIFDCISTLIIDKFKHENRDLQSHEVDEFYQKGQFTLSHIENKTGQHNSTLTLNQLVDLLKHHDVLAEITHNQRLEPKFIMPAVLKFASDKELSTLIAAHSEDQAVAPIMIHFEGGFVPFGVFSTCTAHMIAHRDSMTPKWQLCEDEIRRNKVTFHIYGAFYATVIAKPQYLQIVVSRHPQARCKKSLSEICSIVRQTVVETLKTVISKMKYKPFGTLLSPSTDQLFNLAFTCCLEASHGDHLMKVLEDEDGRYAKCLKKDMNIDLEEKYHIWFDLDEGELQLNASTLPKTDSSSSAVSASPDLLTINDLRAVQNATWTACWKWDKMGLELGIPAGTLDAISRNMRGICEDCYTDILKRWLRNDNPRPTWNALADALRSPSVDEGALADQLPPK